MNKETGFLSQYAAACVFASSFVQAFAFHFIQMWVFECFLEKSQTWNANPTQRNTMPSTNYSATVVAATTSPGTSNAVDNVAKLTPPPI